LAGRGAAPETVDLPHCWNTDDTYQSDRKSYRGFGAYRREIELPALAGDGTWHLCSHGFYGVGDLWLDGRRIRRFDAQYLGVDIPLPPSISCGTHLLAVRLDNRFHHNVLPDKKNPDFLLYGGLVGGLWLERRPWPHLEERATRIACRTSPDGSEIVELTAGIAGPHGRGAGGRLRWRISDASDDRIADDDAEIEDGFARASVRIVAPRCWSPADPHLYRTEIELDAGSGPVDRIEFRFGVTRAEFRPDEGFFLDGERVDLHGANRHESIPGLGSALTPELHRMDAWLLKDVGANFVRLSHYPQHPAFLDACDELGLLVYPEVASWKSVSSARGWRRAAHRQLRDLVRRDRHRPSVILWGMGNESRARTTYLELRDLIRELDPPRPVIYAENHLYRARRQKTIGIPDVWGVNYELDVLDEARDSARLRTVVLSECCNHPTSIRGDEREELTQLAVLERDWETMTGRAYLAGHAVWSLTDYATEYRNRTRRQTGLFDAWRQPKLAAELFRARFAAEPFISLHCVTARIGAPASRFRTELPDPHGGSSPLRLHIFTNCREIRLLQSNSLLASLEATPHVIIPVDLHRGEITAESFARETTVTETLQLWGEPAAIRVQRLPDRSLNGDVTVLDVAIVDETGIPVPTWNGLVTATATGGARVLSYTASGEVLVTRGTGRLYVRSTPVAVAPEVTVGGAGLEPGHLRLGATS
jgi:hypothetical protein